MHFQYIFLHGEGFFKKNSPQNWAKSRIFPPFKFGRLQGADKNPQNWQKYSGTIFRLCFFFFAGKQASRKTASPLANSIETAKLLFSLTNCIVLFENSDFAPCLWSSALRRRPSGPSRRPVPATISVQVGRERKGIEKLFPKKRFPSSRPVRFVNAFHAMANMDGFRVYNILIHAGKSTLQKFRISKYFLVTFPRNKDFFCNIFLSAICTRTMTMSPSTSEKETAMFRWCIWSQTTLAPSVRGKRTRRRFFISRIISTKIRIKFHHRSSLSLSRCCPGGETRCSRWPTCRKTWMQESGYNLFPIVKKW